MAQSYLTSYYHPLENGKHVQQDSKASWRYQSCDCCPYGYHIDLDFVRYCEALKERADYTGSINKRRERRRQRQSMEVLLGLVSPIPISSCSISTLPPIQTHDAVELQSALIQDALGDVVSDFERTLERSTTTSNVELTDPIMLYRVSSNSSMSSGSGSGVATAQHDVNGVIPDDSTTKGANACTLKNIRKQMALGLERMKELEEQVKLIPALQVQVSILKDEKRKLLEQIRDVQSLAESSKHVVNRKEASVMCGILTRTIGVGPQYPRTRTTSTTTSPYKPEVIIQRAPSPVVASRASQTLQNRTINAQIQTVQFLTSVNNCSVTAKPDTVDFSLQVSSNLRTIGVSNDSIYDTFCNKCSVLTRTIGVGSTAPNNITSISLKNLSVPRSKSFNLGEEKLGHNSVLRTIGCQSESFSVNRACQYESKVLSKACQYEPVKKLMSRGTQHENTGMSQQTDTQDLIISGKHATTNTPKRTYIDVASNTILLEMCDASSNTLNLSPFVISSNTTDITQHSDDGSKKDESSFTVSKIPRPAHSPAVERHKLLRQDTYTKIPIPTSTAHVGLSGIDLSPSTTAPTLDIVESECSSSFSKVKQNHNITDVSTSDVCSSESKQEFFTSETQLPISESTLLNSIDRSSRTKANPSKEMQAAMKVLNDSLQKSKYNSSGMSNPTKSHLKNALSIIQQEWFKISSLVNANPLDVEDYLDSFEEISSSLLQYVVNMTDDSGNTAMHYAVSHGNFDVVSILLDSKVCNINKPNKAGYTSVMLVSLTEVRSATDATVVRRLFQLADVNVRARQHGQTALMLAVSHGRLDMVQMLLEAGADINIQDEDGSTALMCAAEHGHIDIVKYFLGHPECDSSIIDVDGSTALKIALEAGHKDIGVLLYAHEHTVHGISPYSSLRSPKLKPKTSGSSTSTCSISRSSSRGAHDNKYSK